jgi:hypothetical protein
MFGYPVMDLVAAALVAVGSLGVSSAIVSVLLRRKGKSDGSDGTP